MIEEGGDFFEDEIFNAEDIVSDDDFEENDVVH